MRLQATPALQCPIVLAHGMLGYDRIQVVGWTVSSYFPGIPEALEISGNRVFVARVHPIGGVAHRAAQLKEFIDRVSPTEPVHIFAHSMGGLDARYLISQLGMADRVLTLTTIGTPHHGTAFADWGISRFERVLRPLLDVFSAVPHAIYDLTTSACHAFNEQVRNAPGVRYFSVAGQYEGHWLRPEWHLPRAIISQIEGANDGIVSVASATFGEYCDVLDADHFDLVNWSNPLAWMSAPIRDRTEHYKDLVRRLADEGY